MSVSLSQFLRQLAASGVMSSEEIQAFQPAMSERRPFGLVNFFIFLVHVAWIGMCLAGIGTEQALLTTGAFSGWLAVLIWGCVVPTLRRSRVIQ